MTRILSGVKKAEVKKPALKKYTIGAAPKKQNYSEGKEVILINGTKSSTALKKAVPAVKVRVSRGKSYDPNVKIANNQDVTDYFRKFFTNNKVEGQEQFAVMYLSRGLQIIGVYMHSIGSMTAAMVESKLIMATAMQLAAENIITCHNHPSGNLTPSEADHKLVALMAKQAALFDIRILDNLVITKTGSRSYS
jgi:DNA repair protein RadC